MFKSIVLFSSLLVVTFALSDVEVAQEWKQFLETSKKVYQSPKEEAKRLGIFRENLKKIEAHNKIFNEGKVTYKLGVTKFTDLTPEEFLEYVHKDKVLPSIKADEVFKANPNFTAPGSVDWRKQAKLFVKDQGQCGSCWSFSTTGAIEAHYYIARRQAVSLSEQNLIDCATSQYGNNGCNGGNYNGAFDYVKENGIDTESNYPYRAQQGSCNQRSTAVKISGYSNVNGDENSIQQAVASKGPVSIAIDASSELQNYHSGVLDDGTCTSNVNHAVLAVGYGEENGSPFWIIKNSWGSNWGENGYYRLVRNRSACGITTMPSYPRI
ncbi:hypothetical protein WA026_023646 [Henosepilachna vigintioctopunctata]|uniref:Uncharacterized protein n=1 Tax=Henosepilachna vigintioctopunctata TaxID=420089 RepID=A0AAW1VBN4_9CUCU